MNGQQPATKAPKQGKHAVRVKGLDPEVDKYAVIDSGNDRNIIVVRHSDYGGVQRIDCRQYWQPGGTGEWVPTKKGVSIPITQLMPVLDVMWTAAPHIVGAWIEEMVTLPEGDYLRDLMSCLGG